MYKSSKFNFPSHFPCSFFSAAAAAALSRANNKLCDLMPSASQCSYWPWEGRMEGGRRTDRIKKPALPSQCHADIDKLRIFF